MEEASSLLQESEIPLLRRLSPIEVDLQLIGERITIEREHTLGARHEALGKEREVGRVGQSVVGDENDGHDTDVGWDGVDKAKRGFGSQSSRGVVDDIKEMEIESGDIIL